MNNPIKKPLPEEIKLAIEDLNCQFMTIEAYYQSTEAGELVKKTDLIDDMKFNSKFPEHPLAVNNRFKRVNAADKIKNYIKDMKGLHTQKMLESLHTSLFDCCAAVRYSVAKALFYAANEDSIPFLEKIFLVEKESKVVRKAVEVALLKIKKEIPSQKRSEDIIHFAANNIDLAISLHDFCQRNNKNLFFPNPKSPDIIAIDCLVLIVDRYYIDTAIWESYYDFCKEGEIDTPVIIVDNNLEESLGEKFLKPEHGNVFLIEEWLPNEIEKELTRIILNNRSK